MTSRLILIALIALSACGHGDAAAFLTQAKQAYAAEDFIRARKLALTGLDADHNDRSLLRVLVQADLALGDGEGAGSALSRLSDAGDAGADIAEWKAEAALLRGQPRDMAQILGTDASAAAWRLRAEAALAENDSATALVDFQRGMAAGSDFRLAADYARFLIDADDLDGADHALATMRAIGPGRLDTLMIGGTIAQRRGQPDRANSEFGEAARRYPARAEPLVALADLADMQGHPDQTAQFAAQAQALAPGNAKVFALVVRVAAEKGDWQRVRDMMAPREATIDLHSFEGLAYGEALLNLGHGEEARAIYQKALLLSPQNPYARLMLAQCDLAVRDGAAALAAIRPLADSVLATPRELIIAMQAADMAHSAARDGYAARLASPQLAVTNAQAGRAIAAMNQRDWSTALTAWRALPGFDHDAEVLKRMAASASALGRHDQALGYADRAMMLDPGNPDMVHIAGLVRLNAGRDHQQAQSLLRQALERDPTNRLFRADYARARS